MKDKKLNPLLVILLIKTLCILPIVLFGGIGLSPDEAQYWTWSQALDFGYYSKPPGIAWGIFTGTSIFGNTELGIRFFALVIGFLLPIATYFLAIESGLKKSTAFWSALMLGLSPIGFASSFFATTDGTMVLFWVLACLCMVQGLKDNKSPNYILLGLIIAFGALFKWPIYLFWLFPLFLRRFNISLFLGMLISLLGLLPSLIWNIRHEFSTFKHVFATVKGAESSETVKGNFFDFLGAQAGLMSPVLFVLFLISIIYFIKNWKKISDSLKFCFISSVPILAAFFLAATLKKMQGNWAVFTYPAAFVITAYVMLEQKIYGKKWVKIGCFVSLILTIIVISVPKLQLKGIQVPYQLNAFRHNVGWDKLSHALKDAGYDSEKDFLFGDKYQMSSILSFYNHDQKRAYFLNLQGIRKNQFSFWKSMPEAEMGKTGYFVLVESSPHLEKDQGKRIQDYEDQLKSYFERVEFVGIKSLFSVDHVMKKGAFIFKGINYNGKEPLTPNLY